jgi:CO/xanthine dehydrogenase FAD-binding subunit
MIIDYSRPKNMKEAIALLDRKEPRSIPLAGGSIVSKLRGEPVAVVDLQDLGLAQISKSTNSFDIGSMVTLHEFGEYFKSPEITKAISIQAAKNKQNSATLGGLVCLADGRSPLLTLLLALDASLVWEPTGKTISLGNWLPQRREWNEGKILTTIKISESRIKFDSIGRSPKDQPILCCAVASWKTGRIRIAIGGFGPTPTLALDGNKTDNIQKAVKIALSNSKDQWASSEYRIEAGTKLAERLLNES